MPLYQPQYSHSPSVKKLIDDSIPSRLASGDITVYDDSPESERIARDFMGWRTLASDPPYSIERIQELADTVRADGLEHVILVGQGGSTQAPMTITKLKALNSSDVRFTTLDMVSPVIVGKTLEKTDFSKTIVLIATKSGSTTETVALFRILWDAAKEQLGREPGDRFIAITDADSELERIAADRSFRACLLGEKDVGGRFSALSVFGLLPAALVGIDLAAFLEEAAETEAECTLDSSENPAIELAAFLYDHVNPLSARSFSYISPQPGRVFGLWIEQMIAESLGKDGRGIVPQIEIDQDLLDPPYPRRPVVVYRVKGYDRFDHTVQYLSELTPTIVYELTTEYDIGRHFILWEYATAFLGYLLRISPFDQPDVGLAKRYTKLVLSGELDTPYETPQERWYTYRVSESVERHLPDTGGPLALGQLMSALFSSTQPTDYVSVNAFLPFVEGRRDPMESIRHLIARDIAVPTSLNIGPRYLHSTGQLHKGGENTGVFLILSAEESPDIAIPGFDFTLGELAIGQAKGDFAALDERGRRVIHLHLVDNEPDTIWKIAGAVATAAARERRKVSFLLER